MYSNTTCLSLNSTRDIFSDGKIQKHFLVCNVNFLLYSWLCLDWDGKWSMQCNRSNQSFSIWSLCNTVIFWFPLYLYLFDWFVNLNICKVPFLYNLPPLNRLKCNRFNSSQLCIIPIPGAEFISFHVHSIWEYCYEVLNGTDIISVMEIVILSVVW